MRKSQTAPIIYLNSRNLTRRINREITVAQGRLLGAEILLDLVHQCGEGTRRVRLSLEEIASDLRGGSGTDSGRVLFFIPSGRRLDEEFVRRLVGTHTVVPYRIEYPGPGSSDPTIRLYVYDCNHPGNNGPGNPGLSVIEFTERSDGEYDFVFYTGGPGSVGTSFRSEDGFTLGTLTLHDYLVRDVSLPLSLGFIVDMILSPVDLRIFDEQGRLAGNRDGKIHWDIKGSAPFYPMPGAFLLPRGKYRREIVGKGNGPYTFCSFYPDGTGVLVHSTATGPADPSLDELVVEQEGDQLVLHTEDRAKRFSIAVRAVDESGVRVVSVADIHLARRKPANIALGKQLQSIEIQYEGATHEINTEVLHALAPDVPLRKASLRADLGDREPLRLKMSYDENLSIEKR